MQCLALKPQWEQQIGRPIGFGAVHAGCCRASPPRCATCRLALPRGQTGVAASPRPCLGDLRLGVEVWPLLSREVRIKYIEVAGLELNVVRGADGRLSYQDILERLGSDDQPKKPLTQQLDYLGRLSRPTWRCSAPPCASTYSVRGAADDGGHRSGSTSAPRTSPWAAPSVLYLDAAALSPTRNVSVALDVGPVPRHWRWRPRPTCCVSSSCGCCP